MKALKRGFIPFVLLMFAVTLLSAEEAETAPPAAAGAEVVQVSTLSPMGGRVQPAAPEKPEPVVTEDAKIVTRMQEAVCNIENNKDVLDKDAIISLMRDMVNADQPVSTVKAAPKPVTKKEDETEKAVASIVTTKLHEEMLTLDSQMMDLERLVLQIRNTTGVTVVTDRKAIQAGVRNGTVRTTITLKVENMSLKNALNWITRLCGLAWTLENEAIFITTPDRIKDSNIHLAVYDARDLMSPIPNFPAPKVAFGKNGDGLPSN